MINTNFTQVAVSASSSGDNTAVAATAGKTIRLYRLALTSASSVNVAVKDGASTTMATFTGLGTVVLSDPDKPLFVTTAGNALILGLSGAVSVTGSIWYVKE